MKNLRRVRTSVVLALAAGAALSACGPSQLGAAAIVEDQRITVSEVQGTLEDVRDLRERFGLPQQLGSDAARAEVERRVLDLVFEQAAREFGVTVTEGDVAAERAADSRSDEEIARLAAESNVSLNDLDTLFRRFLLETRITQRVAQENPRASDRELSEVFSKRLIATAEAMDIRINPRYGVFDPSVGAIKAATYDFLRAPKA